MEIDSGATESAPKASSSGRVQKRKKSNLRSAIVFPKYKAGKKIGTKVKKARRSAA